MKAPYRSTVDIEHRHPVRPSDESVITSGTCTARIFDARAETELSADLAATARIIPVKDEPKFKVGDTVRIARDDGTFLETAVTEVDTSARTISIGEDLAAAAIVGGLVERKLGGNIAQTPYNAANASPLTKDWGFRGQVTPAQAGITIDRTTVVESTLDDGSGTVVVLRDLVEFTDGV